MRFLRLSKKQTQQTTKHSDQLQEHEAVLNAIDRSMATIEFTTDGTILTANQNFLDTVGYTLEDIKAAIDNAVGSQALFFPYCVYCIVASM